MPKITDVWAIIPNGTNEPRDWRAGAVVGQILVVVESDEAERVPASAEALALGGGADGLRDPHPSAALGGTLRLGLY